MASVRHETFIEGGADRVWARITDHGAIAGWFPLVRRSVAVDARHRRLVLVNGARLKEEIVANDPCLRRLQYRIIGGDISVEHHLGTIDVIADGVGTRVVYETEVMPRELADTIGPATLDALAELRRQIETESALLSQPV